MSRSSELPAAIRVIAKKRRWSHADAKRVVDCGARSGLSWSEFAKRLGVGVWRLSWWRSRLEGSAHLRQVKGVECLPVTPVVESPGAPNEIELLLTSGHRLRIGAGVPAALVAAVLKSVMC